MSTPPSHSLSRRSTFDCDGYLCLASDSVLAGTPAVRPVAEETRLVCEDDSPERSRRLSFWRMCVIWVLTVASLK